MHDKWKLGPFSMLVWDVIYQLGSQGECRMWHDDSQTCDSLLEMSLGLMQMSAEPYDDISDTDLPTQVVRTWQGTDGMTLSRIMSTNSFVQLIKT